jgi:magnesium-transporting ATPase (P-type)
MWPLSEACLIASGCSFTKYKGRGMVWGRVFNTVQGEIAQKQRK